MTQENQSTSVPVPDDAVLDQLRTRGYEQGGFGTPLRYIGGICHRITGAMVKRGQMTEPRLEVTYHFDNLNVFESSEPYPFPAADISILQSTKEKSAMGYLGASIDRLINADYDENLPQEKVNKQGVIIGKYQEWKVTPNHKFPNRSVDENGTVKWEDVDRETWEVLYIDGFGGTPYSGVAGEDGQAVTPVSKSAGSPVEQALNLLDGLTAQQWNTKVFQDPVVKDDGDLVSKIVDGSFLKSQEEAGTITKDDNGVYHVVVNETA